MPSMKMIFTQLLTIFGYVAVGFAAGKLGLIRPENRKYLTRLCSELILPFTILSATSMDAGRDELVNLGIAVVVMFALLVLASLAALGISRLTGKSRAERAAFTSLITYPNATFLGVPLCTGLFGSVAILYNAAIIVAFNVLFFSLQYSLFTGQKFRPRMLITAPNIATLVMTAMLAMGVHFPAPVQMVVGNIGAMITPLSLMIIGVMVSESRILAVIQEKRAYPVVLLRNFLVPLVAIAVLALTPLNIVARMCILVYLACPCATLTIIYAIQNEMEPRLCANAVLMSTLGFAVSLPCVIALGQLVLA